LRVVLLLDFLSLAMFDVVRNNKRIVQGFLALIVLPFAFWGVDSYVRNAGVGHDVASVGDSKITTQEFQQALREQQDQLRNTLGPNFNPGKFDTPAARLALVDQLVNQRVLLLEARKRHIVATDEVLRDFIQTIPALQEGGKFSMKRYEEVLRAQGMSQAGFEYQLRQDLTLRQIAGAVGDTGILARTAADTMLAAMAEKRTVQEATLLPAAFVPQVKISDEDVKKYYEANPAEFKEPEQVRAEFVVLSLDNLMAQVKLPEAELKAWYEKNKERYQQAEERRASHILVAADKTNAEARSKARARAEELLGQVKAHPADFAKLAKQFSQDPGSAPNGGDLGSFSRGMMVKPFEDMVFSLKDKEISPVVETDFGFHIIQLTGVNPGKGRAFEQVRGEIEAELKAQSAQKQYAEAAEAFSNMVYEQSDSLKPVVDKFKLSAQQSGWLIKGGPAAAGPLANPKLAAALFSEDAVTKKRNTEAVEVAPNTLVSARVLEHKPAAQRPFETVKASIRDRLVKKEAAALAAKAGETKLADLKAGKDAGLTWGAAQAVARTSPGTLGLEGVKAVFQTPSKKLPAYAGVSLPGGGYAIYKIVSVDASGKLEDNVAQAIRSEMAEVIGREEMSAYLASLRQKYTVEINKSALESK
jgi:peptidyl-prolyl cis-trans isomerase D